VNVPPIEAHDPLTMVLTDPQVPEAGRWCSSCNHAVGRSRHDRPGRTEGWCTSCGHPFSFVPKLKPGVRVGGQYEIAGCLAHGGQGWVYLARDRRVENQWVVLKGLLNTGDPTALTAALNERRFLAEVRHPNIVRIYNFAEHDGQGYIVMEYVAGRSLRRLLEEAQILNGGVAAPLAVDHAIAFVLAVLPALSYLHGKGLLYCDLKPDNVIQTSTTSVMLIDMGAVQRADADWDVVFGTAGYKAPELAQTGPTVATDIYTVGRLLAVLTGRFAGYQSQYQHALPPASDVPAWSKHESLLRLIERATAEHPVDRFAAIDDLDVQLEGVLREVAATETGRPVPGPSRLFSVERRGDFTSADWRVLPVPLVVTDDPAAGVLAALPDDPDDALWALAPLAADGASNEVVLRIARALIDLGHFGEADEQLDRLAPDHWEWRVPWLRGVARLAEGMPAEALIPLRAAYAAVPGEEAVKLALAIAHESAGNLPEAARWYDIVSRTDPSFVSAAFGLARCRAAAGDRAGAVAALARVPDTSSAYLDARIAQVGLHAGEVGGQPARIGDVQRAGAIVESLRLAPPRRAELALPVLERALALALANGTTDDPPALLGVRFAERDLRLALESTLRLLATVSTSRSDRVALVDRANQVRPRTLR